MDFGLSKEQEMMRKEMAHFCKKELSKEYVQWMDENVDFPPDELWRKFVDIGFFKSSIPEEYGGEALGI
jgi:acyl-CoA dehydrogenase